MFGYFEILIIILSICVMATCFYQKDKNRLLIDLLAISVCIKFITEGSYSTALVLFTIFLFKLNLLKKNQHGSQLLSDSTKNQIRILLVFYAIAVFNLLILRGANKLISFAEYDFSFGAICLLISVYLLVFRRVYD